MLSNFQRRLTLYSDAISTDLLDAFRALERVVANSSSDYVQVILTDMDVFLAEPTEMTTEMLRDWIDAMDTTLADRGAQWEADDSPRGKFALCSRATLPADLIVVGHFPAQKPYPTLIPHSCVLKRRDRPPGCSRIPN